MAPQWLEIRLASPMLIAGPGGAWCDARSIAFSFAWRWEMLHPPHWHPFQLCGAEREGGTCEGKVVGGGWWVQGERYFSTTLYLSPWWVVGCGSTHTTSQTLHWLGPHRQIMRLHGIAKKSCAKLQSRRDFLHYMYDAVATSVRGRRLLAAGS